jgi:predicted transglutaminase-like cysteine proteinase
VITTKAQFAMLRGISYWKILAWTGAILLVGSLYLADKLQPFSGSSISASTEAAGYVELGPLYNATGPATAYHDASANDEEASQGLANGGLVINSQYPLLGAFVTAAYHQPILPPPFGMETEPAIGEVSSKWHAIQAEIEREEIVMARCRTGNVCPAEALGLLEIIAEGADHAGRARVGLINRAVNFTLIPTSDEMQWGVTDHWSSPFETLQTHRGDCEDYAILKYVALLEAGLSLDDLKIVILHKFLPNESHAVLAARVDGEWLILDNDKLALVRDLDLARVQPKVLLDQDGAHRLISSN